MRLLSLLTIAVLSTGVFAQVENTINFHGQNAETVKIDNQVNVLRQQTYEVDDTCTRQVPVQVRECNNVTRTRNQCRQVPAARNCWTEDEEQCSTTTSYRTECTEGPEQEVCVERPTREVCRTNSRGEQTCQTVGGGQSCHIVHGARQCSEVPYQDESCTTVPRQRCENVPAHQECTDVPYTENVCGMVTRNKPEQYACRATRTRDVVLAKKLVGNIQVNIVTNGIVEEFPFVVGLTPANPQFTEFQIGMGLKKQPKAMVVLKKQTAKVVQETDKEITVAGEITFEVVEAKNMTAIFPAKLTTATLDESNLLKVEAEGKLAPRGSVEATIFTQPKLGKGKKAAELKATEYPSELAKLEGNTLSLNLANLVERELTKKNKLTVKLKSEVTAQGTILNAVKPQLEQEFTLDLIK